MVLALAVAPASGAQRAEARRLWLAALDQKADFEIDSSLVLQRAALRADSTFLPAFRDYVDDMRMAGRHAQLRREFPEPTAGATVFTLCRWGLVRGGFSGNVSDVRALLARLENAPDSTGCVASLVAYHRSSSVAAHRDALLFDSEWWGGWQGYAVALSSVGKRDSAESVLADGIAQSQHAVNALTLQLTLVSVREARGDSTSARRLLSAIGASVSRDGRPWLRWQYLQRAVGDAQNRGDDVQSDSIVRLQVTIARRARALAPQHLTLKARGSWLASVRNDPRGAIPLLTRAIAIAHEMHSTEYVRDAYSLRGRAFNKLGEFRKAEQDLLSALAVTEADDWERLAEAHHALAHLYEGLGRWRDATREADLYSRYAWYSREGSADYMMTFHDVGMIRWKAGWHAAARQSFEEMVRLIEERGANHYYAGEYYERIGDFARAARYYDRGVRSPEVGERHLNLAGLTRMYQALGLKDSARAAATQHDRPGQYGVSRLLPAVLIADGKVEEALALARLDVDEREARGSPQVTATARLQLAQLLLDAGRASDAGREAARAEQIAASSNLTDEVMQALHILGVSQLRSGSTEAIETLLRARQLVRVHPADAMELKVESALGDAFARFARNDDALGAYDRAALASQRVTSNYESALDRARNRDQRVAPFDGALRVLMPMSPSSRRDAQIYSWSARRKDADSRASMHVSEATRAAAVLADLQRSLGNGAVIDYMMLDGAVFALAIRATQVRLVKLPLTVAATSDLVQRLRRPLVAVDAGQLDLARARFDLELAGQLYDGLFGPLEAFLGDLQNIVIAPDGPLFGVPFSALPRTKGAADASVGPYLTASYLIDRYNITIAGSAAAGARRVRDGLVDARVLVVRGRVPGGAQEVEGIQRAWPAHRVTTLIGDQATEGALRRRITSGSVIHFAVHARADEGDPLASHLELARDGSSDGLLHINEIAALKFRGDLVVLTGCETLPGPVFAGTGPFGIANSFIAAGAGGVIATHWPVGESASVLSRDLHRALASGAAPGDALRSAQLQLRRDPARAHPFYWGGYALVVGGAPRAR